MTAALFFAAVCARAHDPYEITGVARVCSNRFEVTAVFEYRAARLLAGLGWPTNQINEAEEFVAMKPVLAKVAENFFQVSAVGKHFRPDSVALELGVENHVSFTIDYPAFGDQPVTISAPGLAALAPEGQYGVGMTVLDMVKKKVLGQHVYSYANPLGAATFEPSFQAAVFPLVDVLKTNEPAIAANAEPVPPPPTETDSPKEKQTLWPWFVFAALGLSLVCLLRRRYRVLKNGWRIKV